MIEIPSEIDQSHFPLWKSFCNWCSNNGIETEYWEDMKPWWNCFLAGATDMYMKIQQKIY